jgi:hypothetical protein
MRRLAPIAAFVALLALPLWAQRGGGGHGGGFGGGGGHASGGMHASAGASRGFTSAPSSGQRGFSQQSFNQRGFSNRGFTSRGFGGNSYLRNGSRGLRIRSYPFRNNCRGYGCWSYGYPWAYGGYYDPYWWGDSGSSYDDDYAQNQAQAQEMNQESLQEQQMLRQEQADGDRDMYARSDTGGPGSNQSLANQQQGAAILPATVLVFRDQHTQEIQNYAIVGQTLWNFAPQRTQKIPLSELDLPATTKANDDRGLTFRVPASGEGQ